MTLQLQSRVSSTVSVSSMSSMSSVAAVSATQRQTAVYAGFKLGPFLPAPHHPGDKAGFVSGFVVYRATVTTVSTGASYRFAVSPRALSQTKDPVRALLERIRGHAAGAMLFEQTATYQVTTVSMLYFTYACRQASARSRDVAPCPKPMPAQTPRQLTAGNAPAAAAAPPLNPVPQAAKVPTTAMAPVPASSALAAERPGATVSLRPVELSKPSNPFDWEKRPQAEMRHRYEVWNALGQEKPRIELSLKASPEVRKTFTPQKIDTKGLSFTSVDANGNVKTIPFSEVNSVRVINAEAAGSPAAEAAKASSAP